MDRWTSGAGYEQWMGRWSRLLAHELLKWLDLPRGLRWLDLCCGSGIVTEAIAERNAPACIAGVDLSSQQIDFARRSRSRANVAFAIADAMSLPLRDCSFDVAVCGLGLNFLREPTRALEELQRVVNPGGVIAAYVWDYAEGARFLREFWDAAIAIDPEATTFDQARRFAICTPEGLRGPFEEAKLEDIMVYALEITTGFARFEDYWTPLLSGQGSAPAYLATREERIQLAIRERLRTRLPPDSHGEIFLPARAWAIRARTSRV